MGAMMEACACPHGHAGHSIHGDLVTSRGALSWDGHMSGCFWGASAPAGGDRAGGWVVCPGACGVHRVRTHISQGCVAAGLQADFSLREALTDPHGGAVRSPPTEAGVSNSGSDSDQRVA